MNKNNILLILALVPALLWAQGRAVTQPAASPQALATAPLHDSAAPPINAGAWELIGLRQAAHFATFRHPVKVAIIDDGFDLDNPLWAGSIAHNSGEIPGNGID